MVSHALRKPSHIRISANICHLLLLQASNDGLFLGRGIEWISIAICESQLRRKRDAQIMWFATYSGAYSLCVVDLLTRE